MTKKQTTKLFDEYNNMIHYLSHRTAVQYGRTEAEVFGQACYLFMQATANYRDRGCAFGTYLYPTVLYGLLAWAQKHDLPVEPSAGTEPAHNQTPDRALMFREWLAGVSDEVREVLDIVLNAPAEMVEALTPKAVRGKIAAKLLSEGRTQVETWNIIRQAKRAVAEMPRMT